MPRYSHPLALKTLPEPRRGWFAPKPTHYEQNDERDHEENSRVFDYNTGEYISTAVKMKIPMVAPGREFPNIVAPHMERITRMFKGLFRIARENNVKVVFEIPPAPHRLACYDSGIRTITINPLLKPDRVCVLFILSHELGHAFDPVGSQTLHHNEHNLRYNAECEVVAEVAAIKFLRTHGFEITNEGGYLDQYNRLCGRGGWRRTLEPRTGKLQGRVSATWVMLHSAVTQISPALDSLMRSQYQKAKKEIERREAWYQRYVLGA